MHLSFFLPTMGDRNDLHRADRMAEFAVEAESLGYHSVWTVDHVLRVEEHTSYGDLTWLDPLLALAAVAGATTLPLGTIYCGPLRHPVLAAKQLASLIALAPDRLILGLTSGWSADEHRAVGLDPSTKAARHDEWLTSVRRLLKSSHVSSDGPMWPFDPVSIDPLPGAPPTIWQTGGSRGYGDLTGGDIPGRLRRRIQEADGWCVSALSPPAKTAHDHKQVAEAWREAGKDPAVMPVSHVNYIHLVETDNQAEAVELQRPFWSAGTAASAFDEMSEEIYLTGSISDIVEKLRRRREAGIDNVLLQPFEGHEQEQLRLCAKHLLPAVADMD